MLSNICYNDGITFCQLIQLINHLTHGHDITCWMQFILNYCFLFLGWKAAIGAICWSIALMGTIQFFMGVAKASKK